MRAKNFLILGALLAGCGDDGATSNETIYDRLGKNPGVTAVINDFVGRVVADDKINGYFLNSTVNPNLGPCLIAQVGAATGGPEKYPDPDNGCRDMKAAHTGLGISMADFNDLVGHLVAALSAAHVAQADIDTITSVLGPLAPDIVEDAASNKTVYQRIGRKPAIKAAIDGFIGKVAADNRINGFFAAAAGNPDRLARLKTCLVRQVGSIDGPIKYGKEVTAPSVEKGVDADAPCLDMMSSHAAVTNGGSPITKADFNALVEDLVIVLDGAGVPAADKEALLGALGPLCPNIVANGTGC